MTTTAELNALSNELTVDAYNDDEQAMGFLVGAEEFSGVAKPRASPARRSKSPGSTAGLTLAPA